MNYREPFQALPENEPDIDLRQRVSAQPHALSENKEMNQATKALLIIAFILLITVSVGIIAVISVYKHNRQSIPDADKYCTTTDCLQLASDLSKSINTSVGMWILNETYQNIPVQSIDPCDDFYHYVCDGWDSENAWIDIKVPQYDQFAAVSAREKEVFLDELFYRTNPSLVNYSSVQKATAFYVCSITWHILRHHCMCIAANVLRIIC